MIKDHFEKAPCGYFSFFDDGTLHVVNDTLCTLLGYEKEELSGKNVESLFTLPTRIFYQTHLFPLVKMHGHAEELFLSLLTKEKQYLPVLLNAQRMETTHAYTACAFIVVPNRKKFEDELVASRKAAEAALEENSELVKTKSALQAQAEALDTQIQLANKHNRELQQLNHVVTHNLKEPLRKILLYLERLQSEPLQQSMDANMAKLVKASAQMKTIVADLQQYVWLSGTANNFREVDLNSLIQKLAAALGDENGAALLEVHCDELPLLQADPEQIQLLLYHILSNAIKFRRGERARVYITATVIPQNKFRNVEQKYKYEDFLKLDMKDEGIGFDPAYRHTIFELFKRLHFISGQGLGLALCRKIAENHSGHISADSRPNEYTTITLLLPLRQAK
jgi:sigma-B regulation protein RsbU (phosphoserine phosphatase)